MTSLDRRAFLIAGTTGVVGASAALHPAAASAGILGANERVRVGVIGTGRQGLGVMRGHQRLADVEIAAVCDVYKPNLAKAAAAAPKATQITGTRS
jgi:predicted homoserine dehydrogenase-like protein